MNNTIRMASKRAFAKARLIIYCGGKCQVCGYDKFHGSLEFHHKDPSLKDFSIAAAKIVSFEILRKEVDKCVMVCSNCHREIHGNIIKCPDINLEERAKNLDKVEIELAARKSEKLSKRYVSSKDKSCNTDGCLGRVYDKHGFCRSCFGKAVVKSPIKWPTKEELESLVWKIPASTIAKKIGVSDTGLLKKLRSLNINSPGRGYWEKKLSNEIDAILE